MKIQPYVVSIQWGSNLHYFVDSADNLESMEDSAKIFAMAAKRKWQKKRGPARPTIRVWELREELKPCSNE